MALPASGAISFNNVNVELNLSGTATISLNDAAVRTLFAKASGAISMSDGYGKSNRAAISYTYSASAANPSLNITTIGGYAAGTSDVNIWLRKDGNDVLASNNRSTVSNGLATIISKSNLLYLNSGSYFEIMYQGEGTGNSFPYYTSGSTPTTPSSPSITCVVTQHG